MGMNINGTEIIAKDMPEEEVQAYLAFIREKYPGEHIQTLRITVGENDMVDLEFYLQPPKFERIRRITGYLVGDMGRWNNAKRAEEHDRVKHKI